MLGTNANAATPTAFRPGDHIVYPAHGVGRVMGVEKQSVAGIAARLDRDSVVAGADALDWHV